MDVKREWPLIRAKLTPKKEQRFHSLIAVGDPNECWEWQGAKSKLGYGIVTITGIPGQIAAHRIAYGLANGGIPKGLHCLHHCDNRACCNPSHLFVGTHQDNMRDMVAKGRHMERWKYYMPPTHCPHGHEYTPENTIIKGLNKAGWTRRVCRACALHRMSVKVIDHRMRQMAQLHAEASRELPATVDELIEIAGSVRAYCIAAFYGVFGQQRKTLTEIGAELHITRERARQQRNAGLMAIRRARQEKYESAA